MQFLWAFSSLPCFQLLSIRQALRNLYLQPLSSSHHAPGSYIQLPLRCLQRTNDMPHNTVNTMSSNLNFPLRTAWLCSDPTPRKSPNTPGQADPLGPCQHRQRVWACRGGQPRADWCKSQPQLPRLLPARPWLLFKHLGRAHQLFLPRKSTSLTKLSFLSLLLQINSTPTPI